MSESTVQVTCPACQAAVSIPESWLGKRRPCPRCHAWSDFPAAAGAGAVPATLIGAPRPGGAPPPVDPYANTVPSRPGIPTGTAAGNPPAAAAGTTPPLTFADRLKQAATRGSGNTARLSAGTRPPMGSGAPRAPANPTPARTSTNPAGSGWSPAANTPARVPVPPAGSGTTGPGRGPRPPRQSDGEGGVDSEWDDNGRRGDWDEAPRDRKARRAPPRTPEKTSALAIIGLAAAVGAVLTSVMACFGIVGAVNAVGAAGGPPHPGWALIIGCSVLLTPVLNLVGVICSAIAFFQGGDKKAAPIAGLALNGVMLLAMGVLLCIGMAQK